MIWNQTNKTDVIIFLITKVIVARVENQMPRKPSVLLESIPGQPPGSEADPAVWAVAPASSKEVMAAAPHPGPCPFPTPVSPIPLQHSTMAGRLMKLVSSHMECTWLLEIWHLP